MVSLNIKGHLFDKDESIKPTLTEQRLNRLRPLLANGTVTVGNSCMKNDGAALALVMNQETALQYGISEGMMFTDADNRCQSETTRYWTSTCCNKITKNKI